MILHNSRERIFIPDVHIRVGTLAAVIVFLCINFLLMSPNPCQALDQCPGPSNMRTAAQASHTETDLASAQQMETTPVYTYTVINRFPHDAGAFTQGLLYSGGRLYESTGLRGRSSLRRVELETGKVLKMRRLSRNLFGEGLVLWKDRLIQLTWRAGIATVYNVESFQTLDVFRYAGQGWGITQDGENLIMSDGSSTLKFLDPNTFREQRRINVTDNGKPVTSLNELEYVKGEIFANVWRTNLIVRIFPMTGQVMGWIDLTGLREEVEHKGSVDALNGIAYDKKDDRLFVTGKLWPTLFEIKLAPQKAARPSPTISLLHVDQK